MQGGRQLTHTKDKQPSDGVLRGEPSWVKLWWRQWGDETDTAVVVVVLVEVEAKIVAVVLVTDYAAKILHCRNTGGKPLAAVIVLVLRGKQEKEVQH